MAQDHARQAGATRRALLAGAGAGAGVAGAAVVTACGSPGGSPGAGDTAPPGAGPQPGGTAAGTGTILGAASGVPVGGGEIFKAAKVVVTQPQAGEYKGFSAICTHMGCIVTKVANSTIDCPCHGSKYSITDGSVVSGPAPRPLPAKTINVANGQLSVG